MIKAYFRLVFAALTAVALLAGCAKEKVNGQAATEPAVQAEGSRTIAVSFAPQTKTALRKDGLTPEFQPGDAIMVAMKDGSSKPEVCIVTRDTVITTNLKGDLVAVYPSSAAKLNGNTIEGVCVSPKQTGKFADANICTAYISAGSKTANFKNETAILKFYVDKSIGVKSITIGNKENIADNSSSIKIDGTDENSILYEIAKGTSNERICYVAVMAGDHSALQFTSETSTQSAPVQKPLQPVTLLAGTMYNVFLPYYIQVGDQKWGYCNVGAFLPEEYGDFFVWGGTEGHRAKPSTASFEDSFSFYKGSFPEILDNGCSSYISKVCQNDILLPAYDAANVVWKGNWRMPTQEEAKQLVTLGSQYVDGKFKGWKISNTELFLPATGYGTNDYISFPGEAARYWTSSFKDSNSMYAWTLILSDTQPADVNVHEIYWGCPIRPIYGDSAPEVLPEILPGVFTVGPGENGKVGDEDDVKVNFLRGNLWWQESNNSWHIEDHQYDVPETYDRQHLGLFYYFADAALSNYGTKDITKIEDRSTEENLYENYGVKDDAHDYFAENADWGVPYGKGHTLTYEEWGYLLSFDKNKSQYLLDDDPDEEDLKLATDYSNDVRKGRYKEKVEVVDHIGMLLVPDDWDLTKNPLDKTSYSATEWAAAEAKGAVFLPYVLGECSGGKMMIIPSKESLEWYLQMVEEQKKEDSTEEIPEYSDLIMSYFFCQGRTDEDQFLILSTLMTGGESVIVNWYGWDMVGSMRLVEYAK